MKLVVFDASAIVEYLFRTDTGRRIEGILRTEIAAQVPALADVEVLAALRRALQQRVLGVDRATEALGQYVDLPLHRHGHLGLVDRVFELRSNFTSYDAVYVALAERLGAELVTADERLANAAREHTDLTVS